MTDADRGVIGGRYQVIASLGKGGMGQVYKAYDPILDRTVALKKMLATVVDSEEGRQRFYIEARAAARLNHPNIVTIHELEEYGGDIYIVMELLDGVSLAAFMKQRVQMPLSGYLTIIAQIADGLHYAHKRAIVHRDIKPPNLVLTTTGNLKILDFGIARLATNEITRKGKLLGTPHYMAPEQVTEEAVDQRADLFSLGAVAYELVAGVKPFTGDSVPALLMQITSTPHRPVLEVAPETEPALAAIIDRLLAKDRTARFGTGMELCAALDLIGEIDRIDQVAEGVAAVMGPSGEATIYAPIGSTPGLGAPSQPVAPSSMSPPAVPPAAVPPPPAPLFGGTSTVPAGTRLPPTPPVNVTATEIESPLFGVTFKTVTPPPGVPPKSVPSFNVTPKVAPLPTISPDEPTVSLSAPVRPGTTSTSAAPGTPAASTPPSADASRAPLAAASASASADAPTQVDLEALPKPETPSRSVTLGTMIGAPPPLPEPAAAAPPPLFARTPVSTNAPPSPPAIAPLPAPPVVTTSPTASAKTPAASAPPELPNTIAAVPPPSGAGATASSGLPPVPATQGASAVTTPPSHAVTRPGLAPSESPPAGGPSPAPAPAVAAGAGAKPSTASAPRGFVNTGVPQARHRSGAGAAVIVIGLLLLPAVVALGWWAFNSMRGALQTRTATNTTSPSTDPSSQKPSEQPAATTDPASQTDPNQAKPGETPAVAPPATPGQEQPTQSPTVDANAAPSTDKPSEPPARPGDASRTADASQTSQPNPPSTNPSSANPSQSATQANASQNPPPDASRTPPANQSPDASRTAPANPPTATQLTDARRTPPANQSPGATQSNATQAADARRTAPANLTPGANQATVAPPPPPNVEPPRDAVTDRTRETGPNTVVRDPTRENTRRPGQEEAPREPAAENARREPAPPVRGREEPPPSTPADTRSLDYGSLGAFRGGSRSTGAASNVYSDAPSTAAAVARITYTLDAYGDAIAARDLDALRDVRSPVTPAESTMLKEGRLTVRFSNLDVSLDGNDARVRCRRAVVANGKTLSSGPADVRLTRRPDGWVITDIR